tara:strand:+ start:117 stop:530 length:414 start_codon:yes stop_codon:yes gene_type:complete
LNNVLAEKEVIKVIESFFNVGKTKNFSKLREIQLNDYMFSSFSDVPPYNLKNYADTIVLEELRFSSISDYEYEIIDPITSIFENIAIVKFRLMQKGMLVDNKAFTGTHITINGRATFVLIMKDGWKIVHFHLDKTFE